MQQAASSCDTLYLTDDLLNLTQECVAACAREQRRVLLEDRIVDQFGEERPVRPMYHSRCEHAADPCNVVRFVVPMGDAYRDDLQRKYNC
jgi:hypothetical protein